MSDLHWKTIKELSSLLSAGEVSSVELTTSFLGRIEKLDANLNSFITVEREMAIEEATEADKRRAAGEKGTLLGIPLAIKDLITVKGGRTTCGSKILGNFRSPYGAFVMEKLRKGGAVTIGKTNMDEFAMGSSNETSHFGPCRNPWDTSAVPGGSSGGSAVSVAAGLAPASLGSDTGGSIRQPAALCGIAGLKPTYGRVSRFGLIAFASSLDQIGPMARTTEDCAILLREIAGHDPRDSTSANIPVPDYVEALKGGIKGKVIGLPKEYFIDGCDPEMTSAVRDAAKRLEKEGARIEEISLPHTKYAIPVYYVIAPAEASSNLARYDGVKYGFRSGNAQNLSEMYVNTRTEGFGSEVKRRIMLGTYSLSSGYYDAYYLKAQKARTLIMNDFTSAFAKCDIILAPTTPTTAFNIGEKTGDPLQMYLSDIFTISANLAGIPAMSVPAGFHPKNGMPVSVQFMAKHWDEAAVLAAASAYERVRDPDASTRRPNID